MFLKAKELGRKCNQVIQNVDIEESQGNIIVDQRKVLKFWKNYIIDFYDQADRPDSLKMKWLKTKKTLMFCTLKSENCDGNEG